MRIDSKFEDYLMDKHAEQYVGIKDSMCDDFNDWLEDLSIDDWLEYGDKFANKKIAVTLKDKSTPI